jgi:hypothetical protein
MDLKKIWLQGVDSVHLAKDMDQWWAPVNMAMKFWVQMGGERFLIS